jgi:lipoprotein-releasing system permease protein
MARRSFSFLLARRYLNPLRSMISSFSIISLIGVMLGVTVLVVVMAVYAGMERQVKERLLGFTPHVLMSYQPLEDSYSSVPDWREQSKLLENFPGVESTAPYIADNVVLDVASMQKPVMFQAIDTENEAQVERISAMLDLEHYPASSADMGLDDRVVISSTLAEQLFLQPGQTIRLLSTRNLEQVMAAYKSAEKGPLREAFPELWATIRKGVAEGWTKSGEADALSGKTLQEVFPQLDELQHESIRAPERELVVTVMKALDSGTLDEKTGLYVFGEGVRAEAEEALAALESTDAEKMDAEVYKSLKEVVLPKEAVVIGVYQSSQMTLTPDIFMPLHLAQTLSGLDDGVQGIALRLDDAYEAANIAPEAVARLGPDWRSITWMEQYRNFFGLINQQRMMMYVALSVIMLVAAFSMMAVMFVVTIQKRREIGVMKALGATVGQIVRVFLYQGMILGALGAGLGVLLGRIIVHYRGGVQTAMRAMGFDPFSSSFTGFTVLPAYNDPGEQAMFGVAAFVLCSLAALVPAFFAARSDAAKSLRNL